MAIIDLISDDWITMVYQPKRSVKLKDVQLIHLVNQTRYNGHKSRYKGHSMSKEQLRNKVECDKSTLKR